MCLVHYCDVNLNHCDFTIRLYEFHKVKTILFCI